MTIYVKKATARSIIVGPLVQPADGVTPITAATLAAMTTAKYQKADAAALTNMAGFSIGRWTHLESGIYRFDLDANDTDTVGPLIMVLAQPASFRAVRMEMMVVDVDSYEETFNGAIHEANILQINGNASAAAKLAMLADTSLDFTVGNGSSTTIVKSNSAIALNDTFNGRLLTFGPGSSMPGVQSSVTDYNGSTGDFTIVAVPQAPVAGDTFTIS